MAGEEDSSDDESLPMSILGEELHPKEKTRSRKVDESPKTSMQYLVKGKAIRNVISLEPWTNPVEQQEGDSSDSDGRAGESKQNKVSRRTGKIRCKYSKLVEESQRLQERKEIAGKLKDPPGS